MKGLRLKLKYQGQSVEIGPEMTPFTLGRLPENHLCLNHVFVSGQHGYIEFSDGRFRYKDLNSTNGTYVRGEKGNEQFVRNESIELLLSGSLGFGHRSKALVMFEIEHVFSEKALGMSAGITALNNKDYAAAGKLFEELVTVQPANAAAYYYSGFCAAKSSELQKAIVRFEQYRLLRPDDVRVWADLGRVYEHDGRIDEAEYCYHKASTIAPGLVQVRQGLRRLSQLRADQRNVSISFKTNQLLGSKPESIDDIPHFKVIWYPGHHLDILKCILKALATSVVKVCNVINFSTKEKIPVWIQPDEGNASGCTSSEGIVLKAGSMHKMETDFLEVLATHETAHYALGQITGFSPIVPWWLQEGFAQQVSDPITRYDANRMERLVPLAAENALLPLGALENNIINSVNLKILNTTDFQTHTTVIDTAYVLAHSAVAFLFESHQRSGFVKLVNAIGRGLAIDDAFKVIGSSYDQFERDLESWIFDSMSRLNKEQTEKIR